MVSFIGYIAVCIVTTLGIHSLSSIRAVEGRLYGVNYSLRNGPDWFPDDTRCKSVAQVTSELQQLQRVVTDRVRVYSMTDCNTADVILNVTQTLNMQVWLGIWVGPDGFNFDTERTRMLELMNTYDFTKNVIGIHVSSEAIYREEITVDEAIALRETIKGDFNTKGLTTIPVTIADIIDTYIEFPALIAIETSVVTFNQFPFWENTVNISNSASYMSERVALVESQANGRQIIVTETGWADAGSNPDANMASPANMAQWLQDFICLANAKGWWYFWFDSYDSDWRRLNEQTPNDVEGHFGIFYQNGTMKPHLKELTIQCGDGSVTTPTAPTTTTTNSTVPSVAPTMVPVLVNTTIPTTESPTSGPTLLVVETPTVAPSSTIVPTTTPTEGTSTIPSSLPTIPELEPTMIITADSLVPSEVPSAVPTNNEPDSTQCVTNPACVVADLSGQCCPTPEGVTLLCCGSGVVEESCSMNNRCVDYELDDDRMCCPTDHADIPEIHNKYLDCCGVLPDECQININSTEAENSKCEFLSTVDYKLLYEQYKRDATRSGAATTSSRTAFTAAAAIFIITASYSAVIQLV